MQTDWPFFVNDKVNIQAQFLNDGSSQSPGNSWIPLSPINTQATYLISLDLSFHCAKYTYHQILPLVPYISTILTVNRVAYVQG